MEKLKCPCCGGEVEYEDCYDAELVYEEETNTDEFHRHIEGFCMKCNTPLQWVEVYKFEKAKYLRKGGM